MGKYTPEDMALVQEFLTIMPMLNRYIFQNPLEECRLPISPNQMLALLSLKLFPRSNMTQLASRLMVSKQQLTKIVDVLVDKKLVRRLSDENNRRLVLLELTDDGTKAMDALQRTQAMKSAALFSGISGEDRKSLIDAIHLVERVLKEKSGNTLPNISAENLSDLLIGNKPLKG